MIVCNLDRILEEKNITGAELSKGTGISPNRISLIKRNILTVINKEQAERICLFLKISFGDLFEIVPESSEMF